MSARELVVFAGPSVSVTEIRSRGHCTVMAPARQGDVWRALSVRPRVIALIDGVFESQPSVWHRELLTALDAGVAVFGSSSMGALRAVELQSFGMVGVGQVFRWFRDGVIDDDSEVALLQAPAELGFRALTVPLVNVRHAARLAQSAQVLRAAEAACLVEVARSIFYADRTWPRVLQIVAPRWGSRACQRWSRWSPAGLEDLKHRDALECLDAAFEYLQATRAWSHPIGPVRTIDYPSSLARRRYLEQELTWISPGVAVEGAAVLSALKRRPDAEELTARGLRRALLAGWARELGFQSAGEQALEAQMLANAERILVDGPSPEEALASECRLNGLWSRTAQRLSKTRRRRLTDEE